MDEVNINKYLGQFNPILIVPVLSAVFGAILVFVFGFKRPNEPRFQSSNDSLKKSKRKANAAKIAENAVQSRQSNTSSSAKLSSGKKTSADASTVLLGKKASSNEKSNSAGNNNNNTSSNNNIINKKKTDEKKSENGSPAKKIANKKTGKEANALTNKKSKANKIGASDDKDFNEKPVDFDDGDWFTVQSKSGKQKNKVDESAGNSTDNPSPKVQAIKSSIKSTKGAKIDAKQSSAAAAAVATTAATIAAAALTAEAAPAIAAEAAPDVSESTELSNVTADVVETIVAEQTTIEPSDVPVDDETSIPNIVAEQQSSTINDVDIAETVEEKVVSATSTVPAVPAVELATAVNDNAIVFDEMGEWTDAKPDRKRGNKKKTRKD